MTRERMSAPKTDRGERTATASWHGRERWPVAHGLQLQQELGNRGVQRLIQAKRLVNQPGDPFETEADRFAELVVARTADFGVQRKCACANGAGEPCPACLQEEPGMVRRKADSDGPAPSTGDGNFEHLGSGHRIEPPVREAMEAGFGHDFGDVRIHTGPAAAEEAARLRAQAFTSGTDVVFGAGRYQPHTREGRTLLAHELTHVLQQRVGRRERALAKPMPGPPHWSAPPVSGVSAGEAPGMLVQRQATPPGPGTTSEPPPPPKPGFEADQKALIKKALDSRVPGDVKDINAYWLANDDEKLTLVRILVNQTLVGPLDQSALEKIWGSFGKNLVTVATEQIDLWNQCVARGANLYLLPDLLPLKLRFKADIVAKARGYLDENRRLATDEIKRLGLEDPNAPATPEQSKNVEEIRALLPLVSALDATRGRFRSIEVLSDRPSYTPGDPEMSTCKYNGLFDPDAPAPLPCDAATAVTYTGPPLPSWKETNDEYKKLSDAIAGLASRYPTIYALIRDGKIDTLSKTTDQTAVRRSMAESLRGVLENIDKTYPLLDPNGDFPLELIPIQQQLYASGTPWKEPFPQAVARNSVEDYQDTEFWKSLGLDALQAGLFVVASLATGGLAAIFFEVMAAGVSAVRAGFSWAKFAETQAAEQTNLSDETRLLAEGQASTDLLNAVLNTALAFVDLYSVGAHAAEEISRAAREGAPTGAPKETLEKAEKAEAEVAGREGAESEDVVASVPTEDGHDLVITSDGRIRLCSPACPLEDIASQIKRKFSADPALEELYGKEFQDAIELSKSNPKSALDALRKIRKELGGKIPSPTPELRTWVKGEEGYINPLTNKFVKAREGELIEADHVYPQSLTKKLVDKLSRDQQEFLLNFPGDFEPLPKNWNASKSNLLADELVGRGIWKNASKEYLAALKQRQEAFEEFAKEMIAFWLGE